MFGEYTVAIWIAKKMRVLARSDRSAIDRRTCAQLTDRQTTYAGILDQGME
jgi:hypothetical protein